MKKYLRLENFFKPMKTILTFQFFLGVIMMSNGQVNYTENFDQMGEPAGQNGSFYWYFISDIYPAHADWNSIVPGDGYAYLKVDDNTGNDKGSNPYQSIAMGVLEPGHSMELRMKNAVQPGLVSFIFTYNESGNVFNEIDIELVADDQNTDPNPHNINTNGGWTDVRFNTWRNASTSTFLPETSIKTRIKDASGNDVSHYNDDQFHTYRIDWYIDQIDFFIDNVLQASTTQNIAEGSSEVIMGFRDLSWAGPITFSNVKTLQIDYLKIEPLDSPPLAVNSNAIPDNDQRQRIKIYPNPVNDVLDIDIANAFDSTDSLGIKIFSLNGKEVLDLDNVDLITGKKVIDVSTLVPGIYFYSITISGNKEVGKFIKS